MVSHIFKFSSPFLDKKRKTHIPVTLLPEKGFAGWLKKQSGAIKNSAKEESFTAKAGQILVAKDQSGKTKAIYAGVAAGVGIYDLAHCVENLRKTFSKETLKSCSFEIQTGGLKKEALTHAHIGWGWACYAFDTYKDGGAVFPALVWNKAADKKRVLAFVQSIFVLRNLINTPANDMGPQELEKVASKIADKFQAKIEVTEGTKLKKDFPLVYGVGDSSPRRPRLIDLRWGKKKDPKITIVGKGVCFDTGGLDLKPSQYMRLMKKDMGGAAHALALGWMIMALKLPVQMRILIPAVENSVSGTAFRPGDVFKSRKGLTVENTNTDAEGRLILADALTYACEDKPELVIDFATLTGSARAALGQDIPAVFSTSDKLAGKLQKLSLEAEDPVWQMPLWQDYKKHIESCVADLHNSASLPGDLIYSALFLQSFLLEGPDWIHLDVFAWQQSGAPGLPKGGKDTGLRAVLALIEDQYG